jgi:hypothetical protein
LHGSFANALYDHEPAGAFAHGHLVINTPDVRGFENDPGAGYWRCDLTRQDRLTWSEKVRELFGVPTGLPVTRDWAVGRYAEPSRAALERVRTFALSRKLGFILDAQIAVEGAANRWIRVLAVPIVARGRIVGLHGLKRAL